MPPVWSNKKLSDDQKALLRRWIEQGAEYEPHWAYIPLERIEAPQGSAGIDHIVNAALEQKGLRPVGEADRRTLARPAELRSDGPAARSRGSACVHHG